MSFPDNSIKGIPNVSFFTQEGTVSSHLFHFKKNPERNDEFTENSINWQDDADCIAFTLNQRKTGNAYQFSAGVAIVPREEIDRLKNRPTVKDLISYERNTLPDNPYHGNILLDKSVSQPVMKKLAAGLALAVSKIILR